MCGEHGVTAAIDEAEHVIGDPRRLAFLDAQLAGATLVSLAAWYNAWRCRRLKTASSAATRTVASKEATDS